MKKSIYLLNLAALLSFASLLIFTGCDDGAPEAPEVTFTAYELNADQGVVSSSNSNITIKLNQGSYFLPSPENEFTTQFAHVRFEVGGMADAYSFWSGEEFGDYEAFIAGTNGADTLNNGKLFTNQKVIMETYIEPGTYKATLVASNWANQGDEVERLVKVITINIVE